MNWSSKPHIEQSSKWEGISSLLNKMRPTPGICVLGMAQCLSVTGREAFDRLMDTLRKFALPVNNLVAFGSLRAAAALRGKTLLPQDSQL